MSTIALPQPRRRSVARPALSALAARPELLVLLALAGALNLWALDINGYANDYYSAAVRSMTTSWHAFIYGAFDAAGLQTVDKPPLALWVQALSARAFGYSSWSMLVPQALMGIATVGLVYDMTLRRFGRAAGFAAGLTLALTPITVAISAPQQPGRAARPLHHRGRLGRRSRPAQGRQHALAPALRRLRRPRLRDEDGRGAARRAGHRRRVAVDRPRRPDARAASAARRRRRDGRGRARLAAC